MSRSPRGDVRRLGTREPTEAPLNIDIREISGCTCLHVRRAARRLTALYDHLLQPAGLTINQFGLLAHLYGVSAAGRPSLPMGGLADLVGMDPTTLNRSLKPLAAQGLVADSTNLEDRRVRAISITDEGRRRLAAALPPWRAAQAQLEGRLGKDAALGLNALLDRLAARFA
jgi:DNA-binding MarR family transcriptional regulator